MKPHFPRIGDRLRALRLNASKTQQQFADHCQLHGVPVTRDMMASWETCRAEMPAEFVPFIARLLDADVTDLLPNIKTPQGMSQAFAALAKHIRLPKPKKKTTANGFPRSSFPPAPSPMPTRNSVTAKSIFLAVNDTSPLDALILSDTRATLMSMIRTLDRRHRQPLLLYHFNGLKVHQIASRLNLPVSNIQARLYRAHEKLRRLLNCDPQWRPFRKEFRDQLPPLEKRIALSSEAPTLTE
jgi:RNA polymerase sigma factor (sigma-70 family)